MNTKVSVIVSNAIAIGDTYRVWGEREETSHFNTSAAQAYADTKIGKGISVIVRPNYNERDGKGEFFREFRSFDGGEFKQCRWDI